MWGEQVRFVVVRMRRLQRITDYKYNSAIAGSSRLTPSLLTKSSSGA
jgi:hypothetical protein